MTSEDFIEIMDELGRRIEGPAQQVYELAVRQVYINFIIALILFVISMVLVLKIIVPALQKKKELVAEQKKAGAHYSYQYDLINRDPVSFFSAIGTAFLTLYASINLLLSLSNVLNPGWSALRMILGRIT